MKIPDDTVLSQGPDLLELIAKSRAEAVRRGIKADSIVINANMVYVPELFGERPEMVCGLDAYVTKDELPDGYSFAVLHNCNKKPERKWIPVTERLPEPWKWILCYCEAGNIEMLRYDDFMDEWGSVNLNRAYKKDYVTHWMPLPEPPKGE